MSHKGEHCDRQGVEASERSVEALHPLQEGRTQVEAHEEVKHLAVKMIADLARTVAPVIQHGGSPAGDFLAVLAQGLLAKALDISIAARAQPPDEAFEVLSKWGLCMPTNQDGVSESIQAVINGNHNPRPCVVIHKHGSYNLVHCRRGTNGSGMFCLVDAETGEGVAEDVMYRMVGDLIDDLPTTTTT